MVDTLQEACHCAGTVHKMSALIKLLCGVVDCHIIGVEPMNDHEPHQNDLCSIVQAAYWECLSRSGIAGSLDHGKVNV